jgi:hypothetical protein
MSSNGRFTATVLWSVLSFVVAPGCSAQSAPSAAETSLVATGDSAYASAPDAELVNEPLLREKQKQSTSARPTIVGDNDGHWHVNAVPYLWFPGMHGTVGVMGHNVSVHASATDVLSHFRFGLAGITEFRYNRFVVPVDLMWVRLAADKALPFTDVGATSADVKIAEILLTPEVGYRLLDRENFKIDGVTGFRFWHLGQSLSFSPGTLGLNPSVSKNWVDPLVGARMKTALSPKIAVDVFGDVGGWGTGSQLEYQVTGLLGYKLNHKWLLQVGYRYLDVNYRGGGTVFDVAMPGIMLGATIKLK